MGYICYMMSILHTTPLLDSGQGILDTATFQGSYGFSIHRLQR